MHPFILIIIIVVFAIGISTIYRQYKRWKGENNKTPDQYKRRLNTDGANRRIKSEIDNYITKHNSKVDYREPVTKKDDYADWGS